MQEMVTQEARILVIDGEPLRLRATSRLLTEAGYQVLETSSGEEGLRLARETQPDLVLVDEVLTDVDGRQVCQRLRADAQLTNTFVVLLSDQKSDPACPAEDLAGPAIDTLRRGSDGRELLAWVPAWLRIKRTEIELQQRTQQLGELEKELACLHAQRQQLELMLDSIPAYIGYLGPDLNLQRINRALAEWWGYSKEQVVGKNFREVARPGGYEQNAPYFRRAVAGRQTVTHELQSVSVKGQTVIARATSVPHLDEQGNVLGLVVLILDVTEQKQAEAELRKQQQLLDLIIDSVPAYIVYFDSDFHVLHVNRALADWLGYSKETIVGKPYEEVARPGSYEYNVPYFRKALASRQTGTHELKSVSVTGQSAVVDAVSVPHVDEQGNVQGLLVHMLDVTAQRRAEEALRASEERYRLVIETMHDGVALVDEAGKLTFVNDRLCEMTGRTRDEMIGQRSAKLFFGTEQQRHLGQLARRRAGFSDTYESVLAHKDGAQVPVYISASPLRDPQGKYKGGFGVLTDVTAQKQVEQALRQAREAAEAAHEAAERARLYEHGRRQESERRRRLAEGLADVLAALNAKRSLDDVLNLVTRQARQLLAAEGAAIYSLEEAGGKLAVHATQGSVGALCSDWSSPAIAAVLEEALAQRRPVASVEPPTDAGRTRDLNRQTDDHPAGGHASFLAAPILLEDRAYGALVACHPETRSISTEDKELSALMAAQAALAVENTRLRAEVEEAAIATERTRLARELHDSVTQALFSASLISETLPAVWERYPNEGRRALDELRRLTHGALAEMRTLLLELRPDSLRAQPLTALIGQLVDAMPARSRAPVVLTVVGDCAPPEEVKLAMYRIAQEALNNIVKHAHANRVWLYLHGEPDHLMLSVSDDGRGFDPVTVESHHLGLAIMRERAKGIGAQLTMDGRPGQGTTITVSWPGV